MQRIMTHLTSQCQLLHLVTIIKTLNITLQTHHVDCTLKRRGNGRFHVVLTCNPRGVFVGYSPK